MELVFLCILVLMMMVALGVGFPVAFALPGAALVTIGLAAASGLAFAGDSTAYFGTGSATEWMTAGVTNFRGVYWEANRDTLIAIPLFVFMGIMLQRSRIAEELLVTMAKLFGRLPGGLGISVVLVGALLAATTGIVGATVVAMGLISLPAMMRSNYSQPLATGVILASGTLGQIIPPSIVLIILADQLGSAVDTAGQLRLAEYQAATGEFAMPSELSVIPASAGDMFMGALIPGLILVGMYIVYILGFALIRPKSAPAVPIEGQMDRAFWAEVFWATVPPLLLIVLVLGSILTGVATVTQAGAVGAAGAAVMAGYKLHDGPRRYWPAIVGLLSLAAIAVLGRSYNLNIRQLDTSGDYAGVALALVAVGFLVWSLVWSTWRTWQYQRTLYAVMVETAKTSAMVFIILMGAAMLIAAFRAFGGDHLVTEYLTSLPGGFWAQFTIVMLVIFVLGFFLDFIEISIVVVPITAPILLMNPEANVTAIWLGVMIGMNIQTSFLTPPFGFALFYLRGVADKTVRTLSMYKGVIPFISMQLIGLAVVGYVPPLANYLPTRIALLSETAPPPRNPRLQACIETILERTVPAQHDAVIALIDRVRQADASALPRGRQRDLERALGGYEDSFARLDALVAAQADVAAATPAYEPLHRIVRQVRQDRTRLADRIAANETLIGRMHGEDEAAERARLEARNAAYQAQLDALDGQLPADWEDRHTAFRALTRAESDARRAFQQASSQSYVAMRDIAAEIAAGDGFAALRPTVESIVARVGQADPEALAEDLSTMESGLGELAGSNDLRSASSTLRRYLTGRRADPDRAAQAAPDLLAQLDADIAWRQAAAQGGLLAALQSLESQTRETLGLREQDRLPRDLALEVAGCLSHHRDVSLQF
ncbi:MAG: TRAP transporter large permease subunit [Rhodobacter sp.]|uniref:TRAP transporter large permease n=1 Tax=Pararhodobacter sp. TaxID=2127056 RepID=UPI002B56D8C4|nr:TRAP transporter large permease subunit [Pararhodobacter sp.]MCC0072782.1 TRAP transporter large permease subunit [Rhodobacter sp.]HPD92078.1 TRAP transporter large permease subunit [Pararhodobacter sp.]